MSPKTSLTLLVGLCLSLGAIRGDFTCVPRVVNQKVELSFWNGFTGPDGTTMLKMIRKFNEQNPDVNVTMQRMDWATYYNKLMVASVDGRGPQIFVIHASTLPRMHRAGFLTDLGDLFGEAKLSKEDFDPYVLDQVQFNGKFVGLPLDVHPQGLYANADLLKQAGFTRIPETKAEFVKLAGELRKDKDGDGRPDDWGFALTLWRNNFMSLIPQFDGRYLDENGNAALNCPENVKALEFLGSLFQQKLVPPPENGLGWTGYRQGRVAMVWEGVYMLGDLKTLQGMNYLGGPMPVIGNHPGTLADSHCLCVREGLSPEVRSASERFVQFLSENSIEWADAGQVPARRSVRNSKEFKAMPVQSAFAKQVPYVMYPPRTPILFELTLEIDLAVEKVMRGRASAAEALQIANDNVQKVIERDRRERGQSS